jgi:hypothetical protein
LADLADANHSSISSGGAFRSTHLLRAKPPITPPFDYPRWRSGRYEAIAIEVDDSRDVAWWMGVRSHSESWIGTDGSSHYARHNGEAPTGWAMYSVERMYPSPLITDLSYDAVTQTISMHIYNTHKENFHTQVWF